MHTIKILHSADFHIGSPITTSLPEKARIRRLELLESFGRAVDLAIQERVDIFLIAGDFFDSDAVSMQAIDYINAQIQRLGDIKIFISPGNHDYYHSTSPYNYLKGDNLHIFKGETENITLDALGAIVYGAGFTRPFYNQPLVNEISIAHEDNINILLIHADAFEGSTQSKYNTVSYDFIKNSGLDYIALGHVHEKTEPKRIGNTYWAYSGCVEGRGFDETGAKGVIIAEIGKNICDWSFVPLCRRKVNIIDLDITQMYSYEQIKNAAAELIGKDDIVRLRLIGKQEDDFYIDTESIERRLSDLCFIISVVDETKKAINKTYEKGSLRGEFKALLDNQTENADYERLQILKLAYKMGIAALEGKEVWQLED